MSPRLRPLILTLLTLIFSAFLLIFPHASMYGMGRGLDICAQTLIPSLFPFMVISGFVATSAVGGLLSRFLSPITCRWLRLPPCMGAVVLMSWIGGYPIAARMLSGLLSEGHITSEQAERCLKFCVNPSPSFAVLAVGVGLMGSATAGGIIYACHIFVGLLMGGWYARKSKAATPSAQTALPNPLPAGVALVDSVAMGIQGMLAICGFALLFSTIMALLGELGFLALADNTLSAMLPKLLPSGSTIALLSGGLDISSGVFACQNLQYSSLVIILPFIVSFGSLSVFMQISAFLVGNTLHMPSFVTARLVQATLTTIMSAPLLLNIAPAAWVSVNMAQPLSAPQTVMSTVGLLCMSAMLLESLWASPLTLKHKK